MLKIAIIGAGLSGLVVSNELGNIADVTVYDKSRGTGGRISTRRAEPYSFDHGAQYFRAKSENFQNFLLPLIEAGVIEPWHARFVEINNKKTSQKTGWDKQHPHYVGVPSMSAIGRFLSSDCNIQYQTRVVKVEQQHTHWRLFGESDQFLGEFDWVICALPAPQAVDILPMEISFINTLREIQLQACFSLMLGFERHIDLGFDAALVKGEDISWISANHSKPKRGPACSVLIHSTNNWADLHIDDNHEDVTAHLIHTTESVLCKNISELITHKSLHTWRYANIKKQSSGAEYLIDTKKCLACCGDWNIKGRIEAAFTSGYQLATEIRRHLYGK